jgi:hypothetical protein
MTPPRTPDLTAQRAAMQRLAFLVGKWEGEARVFRGPGVIEDLAQTEAAEYKLGGLVLVIEGVGRTKGGEPALQAYGIISFDDESATYRMRAFNDGRFLETQVQLLGEPNGSRQTNGMTWGFKLGDFRTASTLRINEDGDWTEVAELFIGDKPPRKLLELRVRRLH